MSFDIGLREVTNYICRMQITCGFATVQQKYYT